jgi:LPS export ABC transporter permease LptG/LPS export ABC transporter permease LptF
VRRLDRYILREILYPAIIGLAALTFVAITRGLGTLLEKIIRISATPGEIWAISATLLPNVLIFTLPMAVLVGILTGFGRLSSDSEMIAMRASGVSMRRILVPVLTLGVAAWLINTALTTWIAPEMAIQFSVVKREILLRHSSLIVQDGVFNEDSPNLTLYVRNISRDDGKWHDIMLDDVRDPNQESILFASTAVPQIDEATHTLNLTLINGNSHKINFNKSEQYDSDSFLSRDISIPIRAGDADSDTPPPFQTSTKTLWTRMMDGTASYADRVEFHNRFALPFACIAFAFVGLPLGVSTTRGSKSMGLILSLVLMFLYYLGFMGGTKLASDSHFSPFLGAWIPNFAFLLVGIFMMSRADREHENKILLGIRSAVEWFVQKMSILNRTRDKLTVWMRSFSRRSKMFRVVDRYVLRGFCFYFALVLIVFVGLFIVVTLFELLPDIVSNHSSILTVILYFIFYTPQMLFWVVPLTVLLAILINLGTMTKSNEILAVKAAGMSLYRLSIPLLLMGMLLSGAIYLMQDFVLPYTNQRQDGYRDTIKGRPPQSYRNPDRKWMAGSDNRIYHYNYFNYQKNEFSNLSIFQFEPGTFNLRDWTFAGSGTWNGTGWMLQKVTLHQMSDSGGDPEVKSLPTMVASGMDRPEYFKGDVRTASQMSHSELKAYIDELQKKHFDVTSLTLDLYRKFSYPLVSFIMVLLGIPFSFKTGRKGAFYGIGICIGLGILYWSTFELFGKLGDINRLSPIVAAWFPNLIFGLGGTWMMLRVKT